MADKKEYVKLWLSYASYFEALGDVEVGRLVRAMITYRASREEPKFNGNERFIWPAIKRDIDESIAAQEVAANAYRENGKKGGRPPKPNWNLENQKNQSGFSETKKTYGQGQGQGHRSKVKGHGQDNSPNPLQGIPHRFVQPTVDEVRSYCQERGNDVDPDRFVDFYAAKGWKIGNQPMKDWKAAVRTWEKREKKPYQYEYGSMEGSL